MFDGFVNPGLVAGLGLASVPLIIHLLNRQRHRPQPWAAMRFVLAAYRKTRRRVQIENLLLLLLRMAAVALLALAIARPFTGEDSPLASLTEQRRDLVLILDGSASTGYREDVETVYERIVARAEELLSDLDAGRGDRARVFLAGSFPRALALSDPAKALSVVETLAAPTDEDVNFAAALGEVIRFIESDGGAAAAGGLEVRILTDMQRRSFLPPEDANEEDDEEDSPPDLVEQLDRLAELGIQVLVEDYGPAPWTPPNLGVLSVEPLSRFSGPGVPVDIGVSVANFGANVQGSVRVALEVDGERRPAQTLEIGGRGEAQAVFPVSFREPGAHVLTARLEGDRLAADDVRHRVVIVPPPVRVLAVNGAPGGSLATLEENELGYLMTILNPRGDDSLSGAEPTPFLPREVLPTELGDVDFGDYDLIWMANVEDFSEAVASRLEERVAAGAALVITLGDRIVPETWNRKMFAADGTGLLPAELRRVVSVPSRRSSYYRVKDFDDQHPVLGFFAEERWRPLLTEVPFYNFISSRPLSDARVLASFDDDATSPFLIERPYDRGRVFLYTSSIDPAWTRLPESPNTLVPLVHELVRYAGFHPGPPRNVAPGEPLLAEVDEFPDGATLLRPDGSRRSIDGDPRELGGGRWMLPPVSGADTQLAGLYRVEAGNEEMPFSVQLVPHEGDLDRMTGAELSALHEALVPVDAADKDDVQEASGPRRGEIWRWLALACLIGLVLESLWAAWIGFRRNA